jgi:GMP synthase (glutamine-hydrolysing)
MSLRVLIVNINFDPRTLEGCERIAARLSELDPAVEARVRPWRLILDASDALVPELARWGPAAVILGPNETPFPAYPPAFDRFLTWVRARRGPTLGICGGHQALALAHGAPVAPVHAVPAATTSYAGLPKVSGPQRIRLLGDSDPLTAELPEEVTVTASHVDEVKDVPPGFRVLAIGDPSHVQIIRADRRPMWGVQFHPERPAGVEFPDAGDVILRNFIAFSATWRARGDRPDGDVTWVTTPPGEPS